MDKQYVDTVRLLLEIAPAIFQNPCFAIKGGTALNLFLHDMPRLSVDIDVVYTDHSKSRNKAISDIAETLKQAQDDIIKLGLQADLSTTQGAEESKLFVRRNQILVKVEVNHVFRGTVLSIQDISLSEKVSTAFTTELSIPSLVADELYASKLVAALDRQHPRDFFDIRNLQQSGNIPSELMDCFVSYIAGHNRPVHEVLFSNDRNIKSIYDSEFVGMTHEPISLDELLDTRVWIRESLINLLTDDQKAFLISLVKLEPNWNMMPYAHLQELPAIKWKLQNLKKLKRNNPEKFKLQEEELQRRFE